MASGKEIRNKIKSVQNTKKITKAMEMVAASKMRKAQDRMRAARPYAEKIRRLAANLSAANITDYKHPFLVKKDDAKRVGSSSRPTRVVRRPQHQHLACRVERAQGLGKQGRHRHSRPPSATRGWVSCSAGCQGGLACHPAGDTPHLEKLIGPVKVMLDAFQNGELDEGISYTRFINTMKQEPVLEQLLPLTGERLGTPEGNWDYLYEPDAQVVIDELLVRYVERWCTRLSPRTWRPNRVPAWWP
jgi:F-type H+-transporting ATPase subunit gamma